MENSKDHKSAAEPPLDCRVGRDDVILAAILLNRHEPLAPHHVGWLREKLRNATDDELREIVRTGKWPVPNA